MISYEIYKNDIAEATMALSENSIVYDGNEKKPGVTVSYQNNVLKENIDYTIAYSENTMPGQANVKITGIGSYKGELSTSFNIGAIPIDSAFVTLSNTIYTYDGSEKKPAVISVVLNDKVLTYGNDYDIRYSDNINEGTGYAIISGKGVYSGSISQSFKILAYSAGMDNVYEEGDTLISGDYVYMITDDEKDEVELSAVSNKKLTNLVVPATVLDENGTLYKVTSIGQKALYKNTKITSITIGNNVTSIENYAFYGCKNVKTLKMGSKVEVIGASAFRKCTKLTSVTLPKSIEELGKAAFYGCRKLAKIIINAKSVIDVNDNAIKGISLKAIIKVQSKLVKKYKKVLDKATGIKKSMTIEKK